VQGTSRRPNAAELKMTSFTSTTSRWPAKYNCPITGEMIVEKPKILRVRQLPATLKTITKSAKRPTRLCVAESSVAWTTRFRRLARDYERLPEMVAGLHYFVAFACLMLSRAVFTVGAGP